MRHLSIRLQSQRQRRENVSSVLDRVSVHSRQSSSPTFESLHLLRIVVLVLFHYVTIVCICTLSTTSFIPMGGTVLAFQPQQHYTRTSGRHSFPQQNHPTTTIIIPPSRHIPYNYQQSSSSERRSKTQLYFMGSDSGILGVGGPEVFLIVLVGYFVLGPSDLYKLVKQIGAFIQNIRTLGTDLSTTFESNMESTLQLEEIRKAQRELNDAFSFRRTINVDAESDAFTFQAGSAQKAEAERTAAAAAATAATSSTTSASATTQQQPPRKIRRRMRKKEEPVIPDLPSMSEYNMQSSSDDLINNIPDLVMPVTTTKGTQAGGGAISDEEAAIIEDEFNQYVLDPMTSSFGDWDNWDSSSTENGIDDKNIVPITNSTSTGIAMSRNVTMSAVVDPVTKVAEQNRFQQQLSGTWNNQILQAGDTLEPMALVMNKIALLEQEKNAALLRLDEEYAQRTAIEEQYYKEQRQLLEEAARTVQSTAFGFDTATTK